MLATGSCTPATLAFFSGCDLWADRCKQMRWVQWDVHCLDISWLSTSHSPICAPCMSSQHSNPGLFIPTVFAPITSFGSGREDIYPLCYRPAGNVCVSVCVCVCVCECVSGGYRGGRGLDGKWWWDHASLLKEAKSGESHAWWGFALDAILSPLCFLASGVSVMLRVYVCMCVCVCYV